ncbi:hypothetical protein [Oryzibacter oryziterrae]|uniref:hypothetical protein n=1 Tax=Oryzibacter oryziterrae TaxID=2766474 RepID=UPI001F344C20|nr:hypothetical protein [Oryzibacter oryziterrae]
MMMIAAFSGVLGFTLGLRLGMFGLLLSTATLALATAALQLASGDHSMMSALVMAGISVTVFQFAALASMMVRHGSVAAEHAPANAPVHAKALARSRAAH